MAYIGEATGGEFLSTPSARRATLAAAEVFASPAISIHALREEGDRFSSSWLAVIRYFYPRPPRGGRPTDQARRRPPCDFYPRPPRGGRQSEGWVGRIYIMISIHALREEGDLVALCKSVYEFKFLSTPSARRATFILRKS